MHDPKKLPVDIWAEKVAGRTRIVVRVEGDEPFEVFSWPDGLDKLGLTSDPPGSPVTLADFMPTKN